MPTHTTSFEPGWTGWLSNRCPCGGLFRGVCAPWRMQAYVRAFICTLLLMQVLAISSLPRILINDLICWTCAFSNEQALVLGIGDFF